MQYGLFDEKTLYVCEYRSYEGFRNVSVWLSVDNVFDWILKYLIPEQNEQSKI